jgi:hypothetical protein
VHTNHRKFAYTVVWTEGSRDATAWPTQLDGHPVISP